MTLPSPDELLDLASQALAVIEALTGNPTVGTAEEIVDGVKAAVAAWRAGANGQVTPDTAKSELAKLAPAIAANDAAADAAMAAKFDPPA